MIYFTSDTHFFHDKDFIYKPRGFTSCEEMTNTLIKNWNNTVTDEDTIYVVGDFFLGTDIEKIKSIIKQLHGRIILVRGNHDTDAKVMLYKYFGIEVFDAKYLKYDGNTIFVCHYPTLVGNYTSKHSHVLFNFYGHLHKKDKFYDNNPFMLDVSVDANDNTPVSIDELICRGMNEIVKWKEQMND